MCGVASQGGRCEAHPRKDERPSAAQRGYGVEWRAIRAAVLRRDPWCASCLVNKSTDVDHRVPKARGGSDLPTNLVGLCHSCHARKTATQDGGFGHRRGTINNHA